MADTKILAPLAGHVISLDDVADPVFSKKTMGDGLALQPTGHDIVAPVSGVVIATQGHAFGIRRSDGLEVLTHVCLETVSLDGKPFEWRIKEGDQVNAGDHVGDVDLAEIKAAHLDTTTMVVFTNTADVLDKLTLISGKENVSEIGRASCRERV